MADASRSLRRSALAAPVLVALMLTLAACTGGGTPSPTIGTESAGPTSSAPAPVESGTTISPAPAASGTVQVDEALVRYLPVSVGGFAVAYSPEATRDVVADPELVRSATAVAYGLAVDPATGDLVAAAVVRLKPDVFGGDFFRGWRSSYDTAACAQAGGVSGHAEAQLGGRTVYIGTCDGGARTYHAWLDSAGVVVSATSVGAKRLGEQLMGGLRS